MGMLKQHVESLKQEQTSLHQEQERTLGGTVKTNVWWKAGISHRRTKGKGEKRSEMRRRSQQQLFQKETKASEVGEMIKNVAPEKVRT